MGRSQYQHDFPLHRADHDGGGLACPRASPADQCWHRWLVAGLPALWFVYTLGRGALWHWYPYPFLQVPTHGYPTVLVNAVLVTLVLTAVSALFAAGDRKLPPAPGPSILAQAPIADRRQ